MSWWKELDPTWKALVTAGALIGGGATVTGIAARYATAASLAKHEAAEAAERKQLAAQQAKTATDVAVHDALLVEFKEDLHYIRDQTNETAKAIRGARVLPMPPHRSPK